MSGRGKGRGSLIKQLLEQQGSSSSTEKQATVVELTHDSGVVTTAPTDAEMQSSLPSSITRAGRGNMMEMVSTLSDLSVMECSSASAVTAVGGRGRAHLMQNILRTSSDEDSSGIKSMVSGLGRGRGIELTKPQNEPSLIDDTTKRTESINVPSSDEPEPIIRRGTKGTIMKAVCNYIRLDSDPDKGVFEYEVKFNPSVDSKNLRFKYLNEHRDKFGGTRTFDGVILYLPINLGHPVVIYNSKTIDGNDLEIQLVFKRKKPLRECIQLYNVLFDRIFKTLKYVRFDRKQYDPTQPKIIPQRKLEVWPGYVTAVDEYEGGIMLCCDVSHRILCQTTVLEKLKEIYQSNPSQFQDLAKKSLLGAVVLTRYNNKNYRIDDIDFNSNPSQTFKTLTREISFNEYYKSQYNIELTEPNQPLLVSIKQRRVAGKEAPEELRFCLMPEICYLTGLTDEYRSDYKVMADIATFTRITPNQRIGGLRKFYTNVNDSKEARDILANWGLTLANDLEYVDGRQLEEEVVYFGNKSFPVGKNADFSRYATSNDLLEIVNISNWLIIHTKNDTKHADSFLKCIDRNSAPIGMKVLKPTIKVLNNDRTESYVNALREMVNSKTQIVVLICPTSRDDRYAAIKKICCAEIPVPSQVINARTLNNENKLRGIVQKIMLQMNCKMGGTLWSVKIPFNKVMICGIDSYHDANQKGNSVGAFVASLNGVYTRWFSHVTIQTKKEEIVNGLCMAMKLALKEYQKFNSFLPDKIIIFRDGVGDGQLKLVQEYEVPQLQDACRIEYENYSPSITFIVVQKRINTRIIIESRNMELANPNPGFIVDRTVTRKNLYDFFLVSQAVRQGTVTPTHYIVLQDNAKFSPDIIQRLSYKLCFLYYNWPGTVRVPACCQYAHKLSYLIGQNVKRVPAEKLADKLFYL